MRQLPLYDGDRAFPCESGERLNDDPGCTRCKAHEAATTVCVPAELTGEPGTRGRLLVVLDSPGSLEDRSGRPLLGSTGQYLRKTLGDLWDGEIVFTYAYRCFPGAKKIAPSAMVACAPYLRQTYAETQPDVVLCFGAGAMNNVVGRSYPPLSVRRGYAILDDGTPVFLMLHPTHALRNRTVGSWLDSDLRWALGEPELRDVPHDGVCYLADTVEDTEAAIADLEIAEAITLDFETFGRPGNREFEILNMALTPAGDNMAYVWDAKAFSDPDIRDSILWFLDSTKVPLGGHNFKFDAVCANMVYGCRLRADFDTMLWRKLLDATVQRRLEYAQPVIGMSGGKDEAKKYIDAGSRELRKMVKTPDTQPKLFNMPADRLASAVRRIGLGDEPKAYSFAAIPPDVRSRYNGIDTVSTDRLRSYYGAQMEDRPNIKLVWDRVGRALNHAVTTMECNGVAADRAKIAEIQTSMQKQVDEAMHVLKGVDSEVNWNHAPSVAKTLTRVMGRPITSTAKDVLAKLNHPAVDALVTYRKASKFKAQYADSMSHFVRDDGRIHPSFNIDGTETGRPSCEKPNLLNIPRAKTEAGKLCRDVFTSEDGNLLVEVDYSQIELRVAAAQSGDKKMIDFFKRGIDFHLATAKMVAPLLGVDPDSIDEESELRSQAKAINFGVLYGTGAAGLAATLGIPVQEAKRLVTAILGQFSQLQAWIDERLTFARRYGFAPTWWDGIMPFRERPLPDIFSPIDEERMTAERSSWNTFIQGTAAEYTNASLGEIQRQLDVGMLPASAKLVLTVYDSILLEVAEADVDELIVGVTDIMESWRMDGGVPLVADVKVGKSWGSLENYA